MGSVIGPDEGVKLPVAPWPVVFSQVRSGRFGGEEVVRGILHPHLDPLDPAVQQRLASAAAGGRVHWETLDDGEVEVVLVRPLRPDPPPRWWLHLLLLFLTLLTTLAAGALLSGVDPLGTRLWVWRGVGVPLPTALDPAALLAGIPFALPFVGILLGHEMGHYFAARHHGIRVSLPVFIPMVPTLSVVGTLGAFIRIRSPIARRSQLFDVGVAGPVVSLLLSLPVLFVGLLLSGPAGGTVDPLTPYVVGFLGEAIWIGDSLLVRGLAELTLGGVVGEVPVLLHPVAFAGWLGLFVTALNLLPMGQLDGGHILHALSAPLQRRMGRLALLSLLPLGLLWWGWWLWGLVILIVSRRRIAHPPVLQEGVPLDPVRSRLARLAILVFFLTFVPIPIRI